MKKMIVFDFDGVLVDSVEIKTLAFQEMYADLSPSVVDEVGKYHQDHGGVSRFEKFRLFEARFRNYQPSQEQIEELANRFSDIVKQKVVSAAEFEGASKLLNKFAQSELLLGVNTGTPQIEMMEILQRRGWRDYFDVVKGSPDSKVANFEFILDKFELTPDELVFVGDAQTDMDAADKMGVDFLPFCGPDAKPGFSKRVPSELLLRDLKLIADKLHTLM